ncbi:DoxX-like family protein [Ottowia testudinis]|uniref:DoxX-like family protein n=1 Tax=Ottowia testudinis TaxID=2816950 RepID=A0A975CKM1_9BURK|nr:DoxX-like family protein [Ottowia testudinis]QTD46732.1 DoxX-like family protein [Ottowia testudinis]
MKPHRFRATTAPTADLRLLRHSLVAVWLWTAVVSVVERHGQSAQLLQAGGVASPALAQALILGGATLDAVLGLALWRCPRRAVLATAGAAVLVMTAIASALLPALWLHPLGPLSKNLPILAALWLLWGAEK